MKFDDIKATLVRYADLSRCALTQLASWMHRGDRSVYAPSVQVAVVTNSSGETICYCPIESCYMVSSYAANPQATEPERYLAGEAIDFALVSQAQMKGVRKLLIALPDNFPSEPEERWIRIVEREVPQIAAMQVGYPTQSTAAMLNEGLEKRPYV